MKNRLTEFNKLFLCPVHKSAMKKMKLNELNECYEFLSDNDSLDANQFAAKLNMWHVDSKVRPKNVTTMWAMLCAANSATMPKREKPQRVAK